MTPRHFACLVFRSDADQISCEADQVSIELVGAEQHGVTQEVLENAAAAVLHYFRTDKGLKNVPLNEFAHAMVLVLRGFGFNVRVEDEEPPPVRVLETDLEGIAEECGGAFELGFFPRLRRELEVHLEQEPQVIRFTGLRSCVLRLSGSQRWSRRCQALNDQIVDYMRDCLGRVSGKIRCAVVVE